METTNKKARIYNVIILDKSGSMSSIAQQAIDGVNETLGAIRSSQLRDPEQDNLVTLVAFCGCETRMICENQPIADVQNITERDYRPCCMTPLYDAVGTTVTRLRKATEGEKCAVAVTIITDGYENASKEFTGQAVKKLIDDCRNQGWMFAYIGADHDVEAVATQLSIHNAMRFNKSAAGTRKMFARERSAKMGWMNKMACMLRDDTISDEDRNMAMKKESDSYFDDEEAK
ncbi:MAG: VWA domain-containing protein [Muribaculaceae bacterium]|nr:VWA domain-containing protein [Muribaculaceae bacterium]